MNDLVVVEKPAEWDRLKQLVLDSVSSPITKRVYNMALEEFLAWFKQAPRPGFTKAAVSAWRTPSSSPSVARGPYGTPSRSWGSESRLPSRPRGHPVCKRHPVAASLNSIRGRTNMDAFLRDIRHSVRMFLRTPGFTLTAVAALALGIGANTAIFSVVNAVLLKPIPVPDPDRLVMLMNTFVGGTGPARSSSAASPAKFEHWRAQSDVLQDVSAYRTGVMNYTAKDVVEQVRSMQMSAGGFRCWGMRILRGRAYTEQEDLPNSPQVALISEGFWTRRFARDPQILGHSISLGGEPYTVSGIVAANPGLLEIGPPSDVYVPFQIDPNTTDQGHYFEVVARLKRGVSLKQAQARLQASAAQYRDKFPNILGPKDSFTVMPFQEALVENVRPVLLVLFGAVSLVLLIACANVANLLLVRATNRRREIAIRAAIGAGRSRMIRQLLTESVLLSLAGGVLGLLLGFAGIRALLSINTAGLPLLGQDGTGVGIDWRVLLFAFGVSLVTGIVFGLFPALQGSRTDLNPVLKDSSGRSGTGLRQNKARAALVVSEMSLAVILLVGSALLIRTFVALYAVDRGFDASNVVTMKMSLTGARFQKTAGVAQVVHDGLERLRALPGVTVATASCCLPLQGAFGDPFNIVGRPLGNAPFTGSAGWSKVAPGFFETFKIPVKHGRTFTDRDDAGSPAVAIVNETMARRFWKDADPLKDRILIGGGGATMKEFKAEPIRQIVGIVGDLRDSGLNREPGPRIYVPLPQVPDALNALDLTIYPLAWIVRTVANPAALAPTIQEQLRQATGLPVADVHSMDEVVSLSTARERFNMLLMTVFGCCALLLAAIGIYGLMAYSVEQRTQEIGIRLALGAEGSQVRNMVVRQGLALASAGVIVGIAAALGLTRFLQSLLFGVKARDPLTFVSVPALLIVVALISVWIPAARASKVNPVESLRYE
ncbi:MAG TPA: ABC transporter permease [Bryobacteraceae bacterium]